MTAAFAELLEQFARGVPVFEALHDEALELLDDHEDELTEAQRTALDDLRFAFYDVSEIRSDAQRRARLGAVIDRLLAAFQKQTGDRLT